ncbi:MAG: HAD family phosphatase [Verrucomicrobia bacterium]|nr:HAD family phosphatase [Verrucomicrobiota bacterium]
MSREFLFDIGNVILRFDFKSAAERLAGLSGSSSDEVLLRLADFKNALESGTISDADFITQSIERIGFRGTRNEFAEIWSDIFTENAPMIHLVEQLAKKHPLYLFSNTSGLHKDWFINRYAVFAHFKGGIFSHEVRCMKPDPAFYKQAVSRLGLDPATTFYIDDLTENISAGEKFGFICHHYSPARHTALENQIERWLID